jgi:hypothetical protein
VLEQPAAALVDVEALIRGLRHRVQPTPAPRGVLTLTLSG